MLKTIGAQTSLMAPLARPLTMSASALQRKGAAAKLTHGDRGPVFSNQGGNMVCAVVVARP